MKDVFRQYLIDLYMSVPLGLYVALLIIFFVGVFAFVLGSKRNRWRKICCLLLVEYLFLLFSSTVFFRQDPKLIGYEFMPFWSYKAIQTGWIELLFENIMNVVVFIPIGLLLGCVFQTITWRVVLIIGLCLSISIETLQYVFKSGFSETDDVLHNILGCLLGYGLYEGLFFVTKRYCSKNNV